MEFISSASFSHGPNSESSFRNRGRNDSVSTCKTVSSPKLRKDLVEGSQNIYILTFLFHTGVELMAEISYFSLHAERALLLKLSKQEETE